MLSTVTLLDFSRLGKTQTQCFHRLTRVLTASSLGQMLSQVDLQRWNCVAEALHWGCDLIYGTPVSGVLTRLIQLGVQPVLQTSAGYNTKDVPLLLDMAQRYGDEFFLQR